MTHIEPVLCNLLKKFVNFFFFSMLGENVRSLSVFCTKVYTCLVRYLENSKHSQKPAGPSWVFSDWRDGQLYSFQF